jgi:hypothetical protein
MTKPSECGGRGAEGGILGMASLKDSGLLLNGRLVDVAAAGGVGAPGSR